MIPSVEPHISERSLHADEAVLDAYGWLHDITDDEILEHLLALNLKRTKAGS